MPNWIKLFIVFFLFSTCIQAQRVVALIRSGDEAMAVADYYTAIHYFQQALDQKETIDTRYRLAEAAKQFKAYELGIEHYEEIEKGSGLQQFPNTLYGLAICYQGIGDYENAVATLERYLAGDNIHKPYLIASQKMLEDCHWALEQEVGNHWNIERLPRRINSAYGEFAAIRSGDTLYYTSYRFELKDDKYKPVRKIAKVMVTTNETSGRVLGRGFNEDTVHTAHVAISHDEEKLFFTRCRFTAGAQISCQLCVRKKDRRHRWQKTFQTLPEPINLSGFTTTQPAIMWDSLAQKEYLLFVSDRTGGKGRFDIWQVPIPENLQKWEIPKPIEAVNSSFADISPNFNALDQGLYFSSQRSPSFGGYDLFKTPYLGNGKWGSIENLGADINTAYDDTYPFVETSNEQFYFSSNRPGGRYLDGESKSCCPDIFKAKFIPPVKELDTLLTPIKPIPTEEIIVKVEKPEPRTLEEFLPLRLYFDNDQPNPRTRKTTTRLAYSETYYDYQNQESVYYEQFEDDEKEQDDIAVFFNDDVTGGFEKLDRFSTILLELLEDGQTIEIFLKGYTSPRAKGDYNLLLGKRRVSAVRNHFENWKNGVLVQYITSKQLNISEVSFGETKAALSARDEKSGERLSIYSKAAAAERRVEIVEVRRE